MSPTVKIGISVVIALLSTYAGAATGDPNSTGFNGHAAIAAVIAALNALGNLYTKKPNQQ